MMQCLFLLSSIYNQGLTNLLQRASIENQLLPGKKVIKSYQERPDLFPIVNMLSSSTEYFKNPPTLSSSLMVLYILFLHLSMAQSSEHPIILAIFYHFMIPSLMTRERSLTSLLLFHVKLLIELPLSFIQTIFYTVSCGFCYLVFLDRVVFVPSRKFRSL